MPTTTPNDPLTVLRCLVDAYDALQASDGARVYLDAESSRTFTAGQWLGQRMAVLVDAARGMLDDLEAGAPFQATLEDHAQAVTTLVCAICGNKASGTIEKLADDGWIPEFWIDAETSDGPACPGCLQYRLGLDVEDGEFVLKPKEEWGR